MESVGKAIGKKKNFSRQALLNKDSGDNFRGFRNFNHGGHVCKGKWGSIDKGGTSGRGCAAFLGGGKEEMDP